MRATLNTSPIWGECVKIYLLDLLAIFLLLPFARFILGNCIVRKVNFNKEILNNNVAVGLLEFTALVGFALLIFTMFHVSAE